MLLTQDYLTDGFNKPQADAQQDLNLTRHEESNGKTTVMFTRKRNTSDRASDVEIKVWEPSSILTESCPGIKQLQKLFQTVSIPEIFGPYIFGSYLSFQTEGILCFYACVVWCSGVVLHCVRYTRLYGVALFYDVLSCRVLM